MKPRDPAFLEEHKQQVVSLIAGLMCVHRDSHH
jgi:hypothetical protein